MKKPIPYTDEPIEFGPRVDDLLPPPEQMCAWGTRVTVKVELDAETLAYFRELTGGQSPAATAMLMSRLLTHYANRQRVSADAQRLRPVKPVRERSVTRGRAKA